MLQSSFTQTKFFEPVQCTKHSSSNFHFSCVSKKMKFAGKTLPLTLSQFWPWYHLDMICFIAFGVSFFESGLWIDIIGKYSVLYRWYSIWIEEILILLSIFHVKMLLSICVGHTLVDTKEIKFCNRRKQILVDLWHLRSYLSSLVNSDYYDLINMIFNKADKSTIGAEPWMQTYLIWSWSLKCLISLILKN